MSKLAYLVLLFSLVASCLAAVPEWGQCGGQDYHGDTQCAAGLTCVYFHQYYSQCQKGSGGTTNPGTTSTTTSTITSTSTTTVTVTVTTTISPTPTSTLVPEWGQCGGYDQNNNPWTGPTKCAPGLTCTFVNEGFSQCRASTTTTTTTTPTPTPTLVPEWGQCGGYDNNNNPWTGPTQCAPGLTCTFVNEGFSQCRASTTPLVPLWGQCGGYDNNNNPWTGPTQCEPGLTCTFVNEGFSQCRASTTTTTTTTPTPTATPIPEWGQCGGYDQNNNPWSGPTTCAPGLTCTFINEGFSQCRASTTPIPLWGQCGGYDENNNPWTGPTQCAPGLTCTFVNEGFSQCRESTSTTTTTTTTTSPTPTPTLVPEWGQCGGYDQNNNPWTGPTKCAAGLTCTFVNEGFSQCRTSTTLVPEWGQCGGYDQNNNPWTGPTQCAPGLTCTFVNEGFSQCRSGTSTTTTSTTSTTTTTTSTTSGYPTPSASPNGLHSRFRAAGKRFWGSCADPGTLGKPQNVAVLQSDFGQVTPENSMKWDGTEPNRGSFNFGNADQLVNWAVSNGKLIRGHTLVWHSQLPGWVSSIGDKATLQTVMQNHINGVAGRFKGKIHAWDVCNEVLTEQGGMRDSVFQRLLGESFVGIAFQYARVADPTAVLYINDYNLDSNNAKTQGMVALVKRVNAAGKLIDGIGTQMHLEANGAGGALAALQALAGAPVDEVSITELDIKNAAPNDYTTVLRACLQVPKCVAIVNWGVADPDSWRAANNPLLFNGSFQPKPAYTALISALASYKAAPTPTPTPNAKVLPAPAITPAPTHI
jgi:endo-1,4-beta-xylanase